MGASCSVEASKEGAAGAARGRRETVVAMDPIAIKPDKVLKQRYEMTRGPNARLLTVKHRDTDCQYICRMVLKAQAPCKDAQALAQHFQRLNGLEHPHLCKFVEAFEDDMNLYLIYEKAESMTLFKHLQGAQTSEEDAAEYVRQLTMALAVAHERNVLHGRLSPTKVVLISALAEEPNSDEEDDPGPAQVKICDMGQGMILREPSVQQLKRHQDGDKAGEEPRQELLECTAPEIAWNEAGAVDPVGGATAQQLQIDIWSLGCIVYHMLTSAPPHAAPSKPVLLERVKTKTVEYGAEWDRFTPEAKDCVESMLKVNPKLRPTASTLLKHAWLKMPRLKLPKARLTSLLRNIRVNVHEGQFKRMVMRVIAQQMPTGSREVVNIERAYRYFDRNGDGVLGVQEISQCVRKMDLGEAAMEGLEELLSALDRDGSGTVNLQEFLAGALHPRNSCNAEKLWYAFNAFDRDGSGGVSIDEIEQIVRQVEAGLLGKEQVDGLVKCIREEIQTMTYKENIDFEQFVYIMSTPTGRPDNSRALQRDMYRQAFNIFGMDCYDVRRNKPPPWNWQQVSQSPHSAYRRANLVAVRRKTLNSMTASTVDDVSKSESEGGGKSKSRLGKQPGQSARRSS